MHSTILAPEIRRFILTSIPSVSYLEALLLMHNEQQQSWTSARLAQRLYVSEKMAATFLDQLLASGIVRADAERPNEFQYHPNSPALSELIDQLTVVYSKHLVEVTQLIHSSMERNAHQFSEAFKLRRDP